MPDDKSNKGTDVNWTDSIHPQELPKTLIEVDEWGIKIMNRESRVVYLEMSYGDITEIISRLDSAEAEIGRLTDAINGMKEVGY